MTQADGVSKLGNEVTALSSVRRARRTPRRGRRPARPRRPFTAFVFSGGASLGAMQVGMLRALYEHGITADAFVGTSVGALNAAFVASRPQTVATAQELAEVWRGIRRAHAFPLSLRTMLGGVSGQRDHLVPVRGLRQIVERHVEFDDLAQANVPLHVVAFDITAGSEAVLREGPAIDAIVAACAIPGVFPPVQIGERLLIDGGVVNNTPIRHAVELGAERVYVLPTQQPASLRPHLPRTPLDAAMYGLGLLVTSRLEADIARYQNQVELIVLPAPNPGYIQPTDFDHTTELAAEAHAAAQQTLTQAVRAHTRAPAAA